MAPAYDFTFTVDPSAPSYVNRHSMTLNGKDHDLSAHDLLELASSFDIKGARKILNTAREAVGHFAELAKTVGLTSEMTDIIIKNHDLL